MISGCHGFANLLTRCGLLQGALRARAAAELATMEEGDRDARWMDMAFMLEGGRGPEGAPGRPPRDGASAPENQRELAYRVPGHEVPCATVTPTPTVPRGTHAPMHACTQCMRGLSNGKSTFCIRDISYLNLAGVVFGTICFRACPARCRSPRRRSERLWQFSAVPTSCRTPCLLWKDMDWWRRRRRQGSALPP